MSNHSLNGDPISYHMENLSFKLEKALTDYSMLIEITQEEIEILSMEVNNAREAEDFSNVEPF